MCEEAPPAATEAVKQGPEPGGEAGEGEDMEEGLCTKIKTKTKKKKKNGETRKKSNSCLALGSL